VSFAALGAVGAGCGADSPTAPSQTDGALPTTSGTVAGNVVTVTVDTNSPLATVGATALVTTGQDSLLVTRNDQSTFVAVTAICTHKQCTVNGILNGLLVCPCHDSRFTTDGAVVSGPAPTALQTFPTQFAGTTLTITL
jgi:Rieske Fe-S protein